MPLQTLRIIDANRNRISEGLRFLEDVARLLLNDSSLSQQFKSMRHDITSSLNKLGMDLIGIRDAEGDVGAGIDLGQRQDVTSLITANARRAEEGIRVIEELAKLPELTPLLSSNDFQKARFRLYALEQELTSKVLRRHKIALLSGLYIIIDTQTMNFRDEIAAADKAIRGGARIIQLRDKQYSKGNLLVIAEELKNLCQRAEVLFVVNDHLDIALAVGADGLHIGQEDLPLPVVRRELPIDTIVGCSVINVAQALEAQAKGADYIAAGSIFSTSTKHDIHVIGIGGLEQIRKAVSIPVVAIGGINQDNITQVMDAGADAAAVVSAVLKSTDIELATRQLIKQIEQEANGQKRPGIHS